MCGGRGVENVVWSPSDLVKPCYSVDYSSDPLEGLQIWTSPNSVVARRGASLSVKSTSSSGLYSGDPRSFGAEWKGLGPSGYDVTGADELEGRSQYIISFLSESGKDAREHSIHATDSQSSPDRLLHKPGCADKGCGVKVASRVQTELEQRGGVSFEGSKLGVYSKCEGEPYFLFSYQRKASSSPRKKNRRCVKQKGALVKLLLGDDVKMNEVLDLATQMLVGRFFGRRMGKKKLTVWLSGNWSPLLGFLPKHYTLSRGWLAFLLWSAEDVKNVLAISWKWVTTPIFLKPWCPFFDARFERMDYTLVWVKLPGLPIDFWWLEVFKEIGNALGIFLEADTSLLDSGQMTHLDYFDVLLRCVRCHRVMDILFRIVNCPFAKGFGLERIRNEVLNSEKGNVGNNPVSMMLVGQASPKLKDLIQSDPGKSLKDLAPLNFISSLEKGLESGPHFSVMTSSGFEESCRVSGIGLSDVLERPQCRFENLNVLKEGPIVEDFSLSNVLRGEGSIAGGLGMLVGGKSKGVSKGRKSLFSMAQEKAHCEIKSGKQGEGSKIIPVVERFLRGWFFYFVDARGSYGGLITEGRLKVLTCSNSWSFALGLGIMLYSQVDLRLDFFIRSLEEVGLYDIEPVKLRPTWSNKRVGEERIAKMIDRFLMKPPSPFNFNSNWLEEADFVNLVKQAVIKWAHRKKIKDKDLAIVEVERLCTFKSWLDILMFSLRVRLRSWNIEKKLANHKRNVNTIWQLTRSDGFVASIFEDLAMAGVEHFRGIYKEESKSTIEEVLKLTIFFPSFVSEEDNRRMMEEVSKDELKEVLDSFQKDKRPRLDGWLVEFFLGFLEVIEEELLRVHFVNWVMSCMTSVSFSILINGSTSPFFRPGRGLRKGCPISPLLFLIVAEGSSRALLEVKRSGTNRDIKVGSLLCLTRLLFVDDILLFCDGSRRDALKLREVLDLYCSATGILVNIGKSIVSFMGISEDVIRSYTRLFPFKLTKLDRGWRLGSKLGTIGGFRAQRRGKHGPSRCPLCKENEETIYHLLLTCACYVSVWKEVGIFTSFKDIWGGSTLEESLSMWYGNRMVKYALALPLIIAWGGNSQVSAAGGVIFLKDIHIITVKASLGRGPNNYMELLALKLTLMERNLEADGLSKDGLQLDAEKWQVSEEVEGIAHDYEYQTEICASALYNLNVGLFLV
eukprot:Gb_31029 [translate_table: standard]